MSNKKQNINKLMTTTLSAKLSNFHNITINSYTRSSSMKCAKRDFYSFVIFLYFHPVDTLNAKRTISVVRLNIIIILFVWVI